MTLDNTMTVLSAYAKYRQGRGKKYAEPDVPFDNDTITEAIKAAICITKHTKKFFSSLDK